jgi:hypothetical protein
MPPIPRIAAIGWSVCLAVMWALGWELPSLVVLLTIIFSGFMMFCLWNSKIISRRLRIVELVIWSVMGISWIVFFM